MNPDELRKAIEGFTAICWYGELSNLRMAAKAALNAWELDLAIHKSFVEHHAATDEVLFEALDRVKSLEGTLRVIATMTNDSGFTGDDAYYAQALAIAALKETP